MQKENCFLITNLEQISTEFLILFQTYNLKKQIRSNQYNATRKMKSIAIFVKNLTSGGAEKQSVLLAKALSCDYDVHYIIFNGEKIHQKYLDLLKQDTRIHVKYFVGNHGQRFKYFIEYLQENKIKVIFSYLTAANLYACVAGKLVGASVYTGLRNAELPYMKMLVDKFLSNNFAKLAIANCYSGKKNFVSKGFKNNKIIVIPNCFENISPYMEKIHDNILHIITVGRFVPQKDYETAIRSIAELKKTILNLKFDIIGYGDLERQIRNWIREYGIEDITNIFINPDNISDLLNRADIYLSTSLFEGTSNSIMEAMNANLPIVATNVGDNEYLVVENKNGYLHKVGDYISIAKSIAKLVENVRLRVAFGKCSKSLLIEKYSINLFREKYIQLLNTNSY